MKRVVFALLTAMLVGCFCACNAQADDFWPKDAEVYFIAPADGATISGKVTVKFGLVGLGVAPAGVDKPKTGHHHILIDADIPQNGALQEPIIMDEHHRHFGGGQTETVLELSPGQHTLQLLMGDMNHVPHDPPLASEKITITVQ
jgi:hypothetical protein